MQKVNGCFFIIVAIVVKTNVNESLKTCMSCQFFKRKQTHKRSKLILIDSGIQLLVYKGWGLMFVDYFEEAKKVIGTSLESSISCFHINTFLTYFEDDNRKNIPILDFISWYAEIDLFKWNNTSETAILERFATDSVLKKTIIPLLCQSNCLIERLFKTTKPLLFATVNSETVDKDDRWVDMGLRAATYTTTNTSRKTHEITLW